MILLDMKIQEVFCWEVFPAFNTSVCVSLRVVNVVFFKGSKGDYLSMRREGATHLSNRMGLTAP